MSLTASAGRRSSALRADPAVLGDEEPQRGAIGVARIGRLELRQHVVRVGEEFSAHGVVARRRHRLAVQAQLLAALLVEVEHQARGADHQRQQDLPLLHEGEKAAPTGRSLLVARLWPCPRPSSFPPRSSRDHTPARAPQKPASRLRAVANAIGSRPRPGRRRPMTLQRRSRPYRRRSAAGAGAAVRAAPDRERLDRSGLCGRPAAQPADWLAAELRSIGFEASRRDTPGHPMVVGHAGRATGRTSCSTATTTCSRSIRWSSGTARRSIRRSSETPRGQGDRRARRLGRQGAADDLRRGRAAPGSAVTGALPARLTILLRGRGGDRARPRWCRSSRPMPSELRADMALVCDTGMWDRETPAITTMLRGLVGDELDDPRRRAATCIRASTAGRRSTRSGCWRGSSPGCTTREGRITLPGFYDGVPQLDRRRSRRNGTRSRLDARRFLGRGRAQPAGGRAGLLGAGAGLGAADLRRQRDLGRLYRRRASRRCCRRRRSAKISFRLVCDQDPAKVDRGAFRAYVRDRLPPDCSGELHGQGRERGRPALPTDAPAFAAARAALVGGVAEAGGLHRLRAGRSRSSGISGGSWGWTRS